MKAEITVRITHTVNDTGIPPRTFSLQEVMRLDMPVEPEGFADSVESLVMNNLVNVTTRLCARVDKDAAEYVEEVRRTGLLQLELPIQT